MVRRTAWLWVLALATACSRFDEAESPPDAAPEGAADAGAASDATADATNDATNDANACPGHALELHGAQWLEADNATAFNMPPPLTLEAWINMKVDVGEMHVLAHHDNGTSKGWVLYIASGRLLALRVYNVGGPTFLVANTGQEIALNEWTHVAASINDAGIAVLFKNGTELTRSNTFPTTIAASAQKVIIGASTSTGDGFEGLIEEARISSTAKYLNSFTNVKTPLPLQNDTIALWRFDESSGVAADATNNHPAKLPSNSANHPMRACMNAFASP